MENVNVQDIDTNLKPECYANVDTDPKRSRIAPLSILYKIELKKVLRVPVFFRTGDMTFKSCTSICSHCIAPWAPKVGLSVKSHYNTNDLTSLYQLSFLMQPISC
jgi:hypothetical protein